jgi:hypothetical protein
MIILSQLSYAEISTRVVLYSELIILQYYGITRKLLEPSLVEVGAK